MRELKDNPLPGFTACKWASSDLPAARHVRVFLDPVVYQPPYRYGPSGACLAQRASDGKWSFASERWSEVNNNEAFDTPEELWLWLQLQGYEKHR